VTELVETKLDHGPDCPCHRCRGFQAGNRLSVRHGAKSVLALSSRADEIREAIVHVAPVVDDADGAVLDLVSMTLAQVEVAMLVISKSRGEQLEALRAGERVSAEALVAHGRLAQDARGWVNSASRLLGQLGMSPVSRASLGLDLASTRRQLSLIELHAQAAQERAEADLEADATEEPEPA
jgi:hypothetical protein